MIASGGTVINALNFLTFLLVGFYIFVSFASAIRMKWVHGHYVHIEFSRGRWAKQGRWAPRRLKLLTCLQILSGLAVLSWIAGQIISATAS